MKQAQPKDFHVTKFPNISGAKMTEKMAPPPSIFKSKTTFFKNIFEIFAHHYDLYPITYINLQYAPKIFAQIVSFK